MTTYYKTKIRTGIFVNRTDAAPADHYRLEAILREVEDASGTSQSDADWLHCEGRFAGDFRNPAFVRRADTDLLENYSPLFAFEPGEFVRSCVSAHWQFNNDDAIAPFYANMDYLIALAILQSKLDHTAQAGPKGVRSGIFGITEEEWKAFRASPFGSSYEPDDLLNPYAQVSCAAYQMHADAKALSDLWGKENVGTAADPYLPRFGEIARCRIFGVANTFAMQKELKAGNHAIGVDVFLKAQGMDDAAIKELLTDRQEFMTTGHSANTPAESLQGFRNKIETRLDNDFKESFKLIKQHSPDSLVENGGKAPWMSIAESQIDVSEKNPADHAKIHEYFGATGFGDGTHADAWCGAFVAWCMDKAGGEAQASYQAIKKEAASSASWLKWGRPINLKQQPPIGAVVVISANSNTAEASHVGFFREYVPGTSKAKIKLLGGNQSDMVTHIDFESKDVLSIQWLDVLAEAGGVGDTTEPRFAAILDLIASKESGGNYDARFGKIDNADPSFVGMTIAQVRQWQDSFVGGGSRSSAVGKYQIIRKTLDGLVRSMRLDRSQLFDRNMQDAMAMKLMMGRGLRSFLASSGKSAVTSFGNELSKEWASFPVLSTISGQHRTVSRGQSFYSGDNLNHAHVDPDQVEEALEKLRTRTA